MPTFTEVTGEDLKVLQLLESPDTSDCPFRPDIECVLDVPVPPSVNKSRRVDWAGHREVKKWREQAAFHLLAANQWRRRLQGVQRYELEIILDEARCKPDPDNVAKAASDFLKSINVIVDDAPKYARQILIRWGEAPAGCRLIVRPVE